MQEKGEFLKAYIQLVYQISLCQVGAQRDDLMWWATDVASRNRFQSPMPLLLSNILDKQPVSHLPGRDEFVRRAGRIMRHVRRSLQRAGMAREVLKHAHWQPAEGSPACVIRSFVYDGSFNTAGEYLDPFFGPLVGFIARRQPVLVVADVQGDYEKALGRMRACSNVRILPWEYFLSIGDVVAMALRLLLWAPVPVPAGHLEFFGRDVSGDVNRCLQSGGRKIQPPQLFHYPAFLKLFREVKADRFLLTYECNPWERMCIRAAREVYGRSIQIIGYQHNVAPLASANLFPAPGEVGIAPLPDRIVTVGEEASRILGQYGAFPVGMVRTGCALRMPHLFREPFSRNKSRRVLVALEGVDDVRHLVQYALEKLAGKGFEVVFRTHPILPWSYFEEHYGITLSGRSGFSVSSGTLLLDDIVRADVILYWGTTVSMEALALGRPVVHFDNGSRLSFDPLFNCYNLKWTVRYDEDPAPLLEKIVALSDYEYARALAGARAYLSRFFHPVSDAAMEEFMK